MKIAHISFADGKGGAFRAAYRVHSALTAAGVSSAMFVAQKVTDDPAVFEITKQVDKVRMLIQRKVAEQVLLRSAPRTPTLRSLGSFGARLFERAESQGYDLLNLHWVGNECVDLKEFSRTRLPIVWRVADMWPFCGTEHYAPDTPDARWRLGYDRTARPSQHRFDIDRYVWLRKRRYVPQRVHFVATSQYVADCISKSALYAGHEIAVIPNPLDTQVFRPIDQRIARALLKLPDDKHVVLFGALGGAKDPRKGWDLLQAALSQLAPSYGNRAVCAVFGQNRPAHPPEIGLPIIWLGGFSDDLMLSLAYSAADVMVVPSQQETFGQTASEALACGTPVVAFRTGGLMDIVTHKITGWLAAPFDHSDLAAGIVWVVSDTERQSLLRRQAREMAVRRFAYPVVAAQYQALYRRAIANGAG